MQPGLDELEWRQPEARQRLYELTRNAETIATLRFEKRSGSLATGQYGKDQWTLKRTGFLSPRVLIREIGSDQELAIFTPTWTGGGWLTFTSGRRYHLRSTNFWQTEWAFEAVDGAPVIILTGPHGVFKQGGHATRAKHPAAGRLKNPTDNLQQRALAGAIRPQEREYLPLLDAQIDIAQSPKLSFLFP